ncbi:hypothetical protein CVT26_004400 [Gymnopilus dilepis]|uniref:Uncharacterized protein n=1 Tax=Gymnopilus dilepis TaxID=231916 RepID=A0A409WYA4_9AGAR|nr:hypothetical protein CVT26_004400 [Gymnopilus dilepis]
MIDKIERSVRVDHFLQQRAASDPPTCPTPAAQHPCSTPLLDHPHPPSLPSLSELGCPQATTPTHAPEHSTRPPSLPLIRQDALLRADTIPFPSIGSVADTTHHDYEIQRKDEKRTFWTRHRVENDNGMSRTCPSTALDKATSTIGQLLRPPWRVQTV